MPQSTLEWILCTICTVLTLYPWYLAAKVELQIRRERKK